MLYENILTIIISENKKIYCEKDRLCDKNCKNKNKPNFILICNHFATIDKSSIEIGFDFLLQFVIIFSSSSLCSFILT